MWKKSLLENSKQSNQNKFSAKEWMCLVALALGLLHFLSWPVPLSLSHSLSLSHTDILSLSLSLIYQQQMYKANAGGQCLVNLQLGASLSPLWLPSL